MDKLVYTAATALKARMAAQTVIANNMANASTLGFRADRVSFERMVMKGASGELQTRAPAGEEVQDADLAPGALQQTGRALDVAVTGKDAWIAVQGADGGEAYTRRGDLQIAPSGVLQTGDGHIVMGQSGPITLPPADRIMIAGDGTLSIVPQGGLDKDVQVVDRLKLSSSRGSQIAKGLDGLFRVRGGGALPADLDARVQGGALEGSNVNMTQALVDMIDNQRSYEVTANIMKSAKDMDESGASVMRLPG